MNAGWGIRLRPLRVKAVCFEFGRLMAPATGEAREGSVKVQQPRLVAILTVDSVDYTEDIL